MEKCIIYLKKIVFQHIGSKIKPGSLKIFMDISFVLFEKIAFSFEKISSIYLDMYKEMVQKELNMIKNTQKDNILVIGTGTLPATPMLIYSKTKSKITAIDIDKKAVKKSSEYVRNFNLQDRIKVLQGDGVFFPLKDFDVIFVLYGIRNQKEMINNLSKNIGKSTKIILRTNFEDGKARIDDVYLDLSKFFKVKENVQSYSFGIVDSVLLEKKQ